MLNNIPCLERKSIMRTLRERMKSTKALNEDVNATVNNFQPAMYK